MKIEVEEIIEHEDGSADITFDVDIETLIALARIGLTALLEKAAKEVSDAKTDEDPLVYGEFPGF